MTFKQQRGTFAKKAFRSVTQMLDDVSGGLLLGHQSYCFTCIHTGELVVLAGDGLCINLSVSNQAVNSHEGNLNITCLLHRLQRKRTGRAIITHR
jgi:hypothetical protein